MMVKVNKELRDKVRKLYPIMSSGEIAEKIGSSTSSVARIAMILGLEHNEETKERLRLKRLQNLFLVKTSEAKQKGAAKRYMTLKMERFRMLSGIPLKTRIHLRKLPMKTVKAMWYLMNKYGYFYNDTDSATLYYDDQTKRCGRELYFTSKYKMTFIEAK